MWNTLTTSLTDLNIDDFDSLENVKLSLQVFSKSQTFDYPFENMKINLKEIQENSWMFLTVFDENEEIGEAQISLENLEFSKKIEKFGIFTQKLQTPEKNRKCWQKLTVGKYKILINLTNSEENWTTEDKKLEETNISIKKAYEFIKSIGENVWKFEAPDNSCEQLGLEIFDAKEGKTKLSDLDTEHIRTVMLGLNEKLKIIGVYQSKLRTLEQSSNKFLQKNEELQYLNAKAHSVYEKEKFGQTSKFEQILKESQILSRKCKKKTQKLRSQENLIRDLELKITALQSENKLLNDYKAKVSQLEDLVSFLKSEILESETLRINLINSYKLSLQDFENSQQNVLKENSLLTSQITDLQNTVIHYEEKSNIQASIIEKQKSENLNLLSTIEYFQKQNLAYIDIENKLKVWKVQNSSLKDQIQNSLTDFSQLVFNFNSCKSALFDEKENLLVHAEELQQENMKLQNSLLKQTSDLTRLALERQELAMQLISLEQLFVCKEDPHSIIQDLSSVKFLFKAIEQNVYRELDFMSEYSLGQSEHNFSNIRVMNRLKIILIDKESELLILRNMVTDLQRKRALYIPIKDDPIDGAVADYVNTRTTDVPFVREDHGIYLFGSKKVFVKLENGKIISI